jgi:putative membrane protein
MKLFKLILAGIVIGVANVIPGVSGGTMAVVFGIYDELIGVISVNIKQIFAKWKFWLPLAVGMGIGIIGFSKLVTFLFENFPVQTQYFFAGIVLGSIPLILRRTNLAVKKENLGNWICAAVAFLIMIVMVFVNTDNVISAIQTQVTFGLAFKLILGGALAAFAMIIPGISGSFLMVILGIYSTIIAAISDFNLPIICVMAVGVIIGIFAGAKGVQVLLDKIPSQTYGAIFGLVIGSVFAVLPMGETVDFFKNGNILGFVVSLVCAVAGFALAFFSGREEN